jgi:hypothetical protein
MAIDRKQQDYSFAGGLGNINPAEMPPEAIEKYKSTLDDQIKALQQRYEEPNWFKVMAGFAKPQLGGFLASLGSAGEALGENVEQQREQQLPIAQMKVQVEQANMLLAQKQKQNQIYQDWLKQNTNPDGTVRPMDATTYSRITSLGENTDVARAADKYFEGAKKGLEITVGAAEASAKLPQLGKSLDNYLQFQLNPNADQKAITESRTAYEKQLNAAKPPGMDAATWNAMGTYDKQAALEDYGRKELAKGMDVDEVLRQQANRAPERLALLRSIRDLSLGVGLADSKTPDGKTITGQEQIGALLNKFGGNNPMEVFARAAADGKLGETLEDIDVYARQIGMSEAAKNKFQVLVKLLAENQVALRGSSLNPTDAFGQLQQTASPNIGNSQAALVTLVDLMGHAEKNAQNKYQFVKENKIPYGHLETNPAYAKMLTDYADEHARIATQNPMVNAPSWYSPSQGAKDTQPKAPAPAPTASSSGTPANASK